MKLFNYSFARRKANKKRRNTDADEQSVKRCKCPIYAVEYSEENKQTIGRQRRKRNIYCNNEQIRVSNLPFIRL